MMDQTTWYHADMGTLPTWTVSDLPSRCDTIVVGGGLTGLWAALTLAEAGQRVVLLEAGRIGDGASGRNGGQICTGFAPEPHVLVERLGPQTAKALWLLVEDSKANLLGRIAGHKWAVDLKMGYLTAALKVSHFEDLLEARKVAETVFEYPAFQPLDKAAIQEALASPLYQGGLRDGGGGHLNPLKLVHSIAETLANIGGLIAENTPVVKIEPRADSRGGDSRVIVHTASGAQIEANAAFIATNAHLPAGLSAEIDTHLRPRILPVLAWVAATAPLSEAVATSLIPGGEAVADTGFALDYYRVTPDHRLLYGGPLSYRGKNPGDLAKTMEKGIRRIFPHLASIGIDHLWSGSVGITPNRMPHLGRINRGPVYYAQGFSGQGLVLTHLLGTVMAEHVLGRKDRFELIARIPQPKFPGGRALRHPVQLFASAWYRFRDWL